MDGQVSILSGALTPPVTRSMLSKEALAVFPVDLADLVVWDSGQPLPATQAADDLALLVGAFATGNPYLSGGDQKAAGAVSIYARLHLAVPHEYIQGEALKLRLSAGMLTTVADVSCAVDVEAYKIGRATINGSADLCTTAAQSINSLVFADKSFAINGGGLAPGDQLDVRITIACNDAATVGAVKPTIGAIELLADCKG